MGVSDREQRVIVVAWGLRRAEHHDDPAGGSAAASACHPGSVLVNPFDAYSVAFTDDDVASTATRAR